eukprot:10911274-Alexandrium_andersonii.AAC.1
MRPGPGCARRASVRCRCRSAGQSRSQGRSPGSRSEAHHGQEVHEVEASPNSALRFSKPVARTCPGALVDGALGRRRPIRRMK